MTINIDQLQLLASLLYLIVNIRHDKFKESIFSL